MMDTKHVLIGRVVKDPVVYQCDGDYKYLHLILSVSGEVCDLEDKISVSTLGLARYELIHKGDMVQATCGRNEQGVYQVQSIGLV